MAQAAARLARADLATSLVTEMTGLAGTMGRHYALRSGTAPDVAEVSNYPATSNFSHLFKAAEAQLLSL